MISHRTKRILFCVSTIAATIGSGYGQGSRPSGTATISIASLRVPAKAWEHLEKARTAAVAGADAECERELAAALAIAPEFGEAYVLRASRKVFAKQYEAGIEDVLLAQRVDPGVQWATIVHAEACNGLHRFNEAFALLDGLKSTEIGTWQAKYEMTRAVLGRGDAVAALQWSKLTLAAVPESAMPNAMLLRANAFQLARRWEEAVTQLDRYLALPGTQPVRNQVLAVRERASKLARESGIATVASQK